MHNTVVTMEYGVNNSDRCATYSAQVVTCMSASDHIHKFILNYYLLLNVKYIILAI